IRGDDNSLGQLPRAPSMRPLILQNRAVTIHRHSVPRRLQEIRVPTTAEIQEYHSVRRYCANILCRWMAQADVGKRVSWFFCSSASVRRAGARPANIDSYASHSEAATAHWLIVNLRVHRWQPWQFVGGVIFQRSFNVWPISDCVSCFFLEKSSPASLG